MVDLHGKKFVFFLLYHSTEIKLKMEAIHLLFQMDSRLT